MSRRHIFVALAVLCVAVLLALGVRLLIHRFDREVMAGKVARTAYAAVLGKEWDAAAARGTGRGIIKFRIYQFESTERPATGNWELDTRAADRLLRSEQRIGIRSRDVEPSLYREIGEGDDVTVLYRLASEDRIEIINIAGIHSKHR